MRLKRSVDRPWKKRRPAIGHSVHSRPQHPFAGGSGQAAGPRRRRPAGCPRDRASPLAPARVHAVMMSTHVLSRRPMPRRPRGPNQLVPLAVQEGSVHGCVRAAGHMRAGRSDRRAGQPMRTGRTHARSQPRHFMPLCFSARNVSCDRSVAEFKALLTTLAPGSLPRRAPTTTDGRQRSILHRASGANG